MGPLLLWVSLETHENAAVFDVHRLEETSVIPILSRSTKATRGSKHPAPKGAVKDIQLSLGFLRALSVTEHLSKSWPKAGIICSASQ